MSMRWQSGIFQPGKGCAEGGRATVAYVKAALDLVAEGHARSIVACPHSETNVNAAVSSSPDTRAFWRA